MVFLGMVEELSRVDDPARYDAVMRHPSLSPGAAGPRGTLTQWQELRAERR